MVREGRRGRGRRTGPTHSKKSWPGLEGFSKEGQISQTAVPDSSEN